MTLFRKKPETSRGMKVDICADKPAAASAALPVGSPAKPRPRPKAEPENAIAIAIALRALLKGVNHD